MCGEEEQCRKEEGKNKQRYRGTLHQIRAPDRASVLDVVYGTGLHLPGIRRL